MASKTKATQPEDKEEAPEKETPETLDAPLLLFGLSAAAVRKMIKAAKKRGYVTQEQINSVLFSEEVTSEQIEDILAMLNEVGITTVESEKTEPEEEAEAREEPEESEGGELVEVQRLPAYDDPHAWQEHGLKLNRLGKRRSCVCVARNGLL